MKTQSGSLALIFACLTAAGAQGADSSAGIEFFEKNIRPVLVEHCYKCHSSQATGKKLKAGLKLDTRNDIRKGGESGPAVVPGNIKASWLIAAIKHQRDLEMPPKNKLPDKVINDFVKWVQMGAPDPRIPTSANGGAEVQSAIDLEKGRQFWSFQALSKPQAPAVKNSAWPKTDVDRFILAALEKQGLTPVADADHITLVRRLYFDLIGLPPTVEQLSDFLNDRSTDAIEKLVDRLLASPHFGERWGRHWLDVARYAESNGNVRNATFPQAWRYRNYVIGALNQDKPYDRFIIEQMAGDLLPAQDHQERNENLTATGFLALASKPVLKGKKGPFIADIVADQIEVSTRSVLGLTVACARCHDHKFDPIPTSDYYGLAGIFASSKTLYGGGGKSMGAFPVGGMHTLESDDPETAKAYKAWKTTIDKLQAQQKEISQQLKKLKPKRSKRPKNTKTSAKTKGKGDSNAPASKNQVQARIKELSAKLKKVAVEYRRLRSKPPKAPDQAMGITEAAKITEVPIHVRGEQPKGDAIPRGFISVALVKQPKLPANQSGRLQLAKWMVARENPLAARVMVNRIWLHLFDQGLVRTPDNFGKNGFKPSHPELLDWLAGRFMDQGWSVKKMIRMLVLTRSYRLSSEHHQHNYKVDPDNVYLWRYPIKRLEGELIRDAILLASGQLERIPPKGSVMQKRGNVLIQDKLTPDVFHQPSNHRSVYLPMMRNGLPQILELFDAADPSLVVGKRNVTTVPAQDLYLMNNPFVIEQANHFAKLLLAMEKLDDAGRVRLAYQRALSRPSTESESQMALVYLKQTNESLADEKADKNTVAWARFCQAIFASAEFRHAR